METTILSFAHVTGTTRKFHLDDISFALPAGYLMGLVGKNGAGKSTLMDYIMNPRQHYRGTICIEERDIRQDHAAIREKIGFVSEQNPFFYERSARQNAEILGHLYQNFEMEIFENAMKKMELSCQKTLGKMSRGEQVRFQMAFAMAHRPVLYLLDEPTAGLDVVFRIDFFKMLHEVIAEGTASVLMTTHIAEEMERQMDYVGILEQGRLIFFGENIPER